MMTGVLIVMKTGSTVSPKQVIHVGMLDQVVMNVVMSIQEMQMKTIIIAIIAV
ncbi:hypothetical protein MGWOODY_Mmi637 [hydrothermal vent metagenome]|uniref:Uncharacterized protein n=1 Tax=hydrothermal vent metagenome TaxID=652676 RepID=A0A160VFP4_9ZZZZ